MAIAPTNLVAIVLPRSTHTLTFRGLAPIPMFLSPSRNSHQLPQDFASLPRLPTTSDVSRNSHLLPQDISFSPLAQFATSCHILPHLTTFSPPLASRSSALHCAISRYVARTVSAVPQSDLAADNPSSELIEFSSPSLTLLQTHQVPA